MTALDECLDGFCNEYFVFTEKTFKSLPYQLTQPFLGWVIP
jgi:hypothetical protein